MSKWAGMSLLCVLDMCQAGKIAPLGVFQSWAAKEFNRFPSMSCQFGS